MQIKKGKRCQLHSLSNTFQPSFSDFLFPESHQSILGTFFRTRINSTLAIFRKFST